MKDGYASENQDPFMVESFDGFKSLAKRSDLSKFEKIGFPNEYREGFETAIRDDIASKLLLGSKLEQNILDIGSGCGELPGLISELAQKYGHKLTLLDSLEMHSNLSPEILAKTTQINGRFPDCIDNLSFQGSQYDAIICYSVIQYAFRESSIFEFLDAMLLLLKPNGRILIGDLPNFSMRKRFLDSESGKLFHRNHFGDLNEEPVKWNSLERGRIDDAVLLALLARARSAGFHSYLVPQDTNLPLSNRREDILIVRP